MRPSRDIKKSWKQAGVKMSLKAFAREALRGLHGPVSTDIARAWLRAKKDA